MSNEFEGILERMKDSGLVLPQKTVLIKTDAAFTILSNAFDYFIGLEGKKALWIDTYNEVAEWLQDNEGKGLLLYGDCGRGKSILSRYIIPAILLKYHGKVVNVSDITGMNKNIDEVLNKKIVSLDDIGTEGESNVYGNKRLAFSEIVDEAEKQGKLLIISTNLTGEQIASKYGERIFDRLGKITKRVLFTGKSLRS